MSLAAVAVAELLLAIAQRVLPIEQAPLVALAIPVVGILVLLVLVVRARPTIGETALAVDSEGGAGDAVASALAFASAMPGAAGPAADADDDTIVVDGTFDIAEAEARFVRRQRRDAAARLRGLDPGLFRPRIARRPALAALIAAALVLPAILLPNPMDLVIAQNREVREEAERQAERIDEIAKDLEGKGAKAGDPRADLAEELRALAERLRDQPRRPGQEPRPAGLGRGRGPLPAGPGQRAEGCLHRGPVAGSLAGLHAATRRPTRTETRRRPARISRTRATRWTT